MTIKDPDGTLKISMEWDTPFPVEAVLLTAPSGRRTACLSTQVGCAMGCGFCKTGNLGFARDLTAEEMVAQYEKLALISGKPPSNVVYMGMGEPLANLTAVQQSINILVGRYSLALRRITVSTAGIVPAMYRLAREGPAVYLTLSLPSTREEVRARLTPGAAPYSLGEMAQGLKFYRDRTGKRPTLAVVLLKGINDTEEDANLLAAFAKGLKPLVNLIPYNPVPGLPFEAAPEERVQFYYRVLTREGIPTVRRFPRGRGICGACGQLGGSAVSPAH